MYQATAFPVNSGLILISETKTLGLILHTEWLTLQQTVIRALRCECAGTPQKWERKQMTPCAAFMNVPVDF